MKGANEYAKLFKTGQHGRLYLVSSSHARGKTFHIYVLPEGEAALPNSDNAPLNKNKVEVYGITGGQPGWTEEYSWLHHGKWEQDFAELVEKRRAAIAEEEAIYAQRQAAALAAEARRQAALLQTY